jgi:hypothetical protein
MDAAVKELKLLKQKSGEVQTDAKNARAAYLSAQPGVKKEEMKQQWLSLRRALTLRGQSSPSRSEEQVCTNS